jgi:hypothetical protein
MAIEPVKPHEQPKEEYISLKEDPFEALREIDWNESLLYQKIKSGDTLS